MLDPMNWNQFLDIAPRILKECSDQLEYPITLLFNKSLAQGRIPGAWKKSNITPIFKIGDRKQAVIIGRLASRKL